MIVQKFKFVSYEVFNVNNFIASEMPAPYIKLTLDIAHYTVKLLDDICPNELLFLKMRDHFTKGKPLYEHR